MTSTKAGCKTNTTKKLGNIFTFHRYCMFAKYHLMTIITYITKLCIWKIHVHMINPVHASCVGSTVCV